MTANLNDRVKQRAASIRRTWRELVRNRRPQIHDDNSDSERVDDHAWENFVPFNNFSDRPFYNFNKFDDRPYR